MRGGQTWSAEYQRPLVTSVGEDSHLSRNITPTTQKVPDSD